MLHWQMQTANAAYQHRWIGLELINFTGFIGVTDGAIYRIPQIDLPFNDLLPVRSQRIFEVSHKNFHIGIERVNHHFSLNRSGNFNTTI